MKYFFLHLGKAAGSTFNTILKKTFKEKYTKVYGKEIIDKGKIVPKGFFDNIEDLNFYLKENTEIISSHYFKFETIHKDFKVITFFRDPKSRTISSYFYQLKSYDLIHQGKKKITDYKAQIFYDYGRFKSYKDLVDFQKKYSLGSNDEIYYLTTFSKNLKLNEAINNLDKIFFIGLSEYFDESLLLLKNELKKNKINLKIFYRRENEQSIRDKNLTNTIKLELDSYKDKFKDDEIIYNKAKNLFLNQLNKQSFKFKLQLIIFKFLNFNYQVFFKTFLIFKFIIKKILRRN